jgi:hypothetical protein
MVKHPIANEVFTQNLVDPQHLQTGAARLKACALGFNRIYIYNNYKDKLSIKSVDNFFFVRNINGLKVYFAPEKLLYRAVGKMG